MLRSNNHAILGSDILLPLEWVLKFPPLSLGTRIAVRGGMLV